MKKLLLFVLLLSLLVTMFVGCKKEDDATVVIAEEVAEVIIKVNGNDITLNEFNKYYAMQSYDFEKEYGKDVWTIERDGKTMKQIREEQTIEYLIRLEILKEYAKENGYNSSNALVEEVYEKYLESIETNTELKDYFTENDLDEEFIKKFLEDQLYLREYHFIVIQNIYDSQESLDLLFKDKVIRYKTSHILVEETDKELLEKIKIDIESGEADFAEMAREHSIHSASAINGGALDYVLIGTMPVEYEKAALSIEVGIVSDLIKTEDGYHIIFVEDRQSLADLSELGMSEEEISTYRDEIVDKFASNERVRIFDELRDKASVEIDSELLKTEE